MSLKFFACIFHRISETFHDLRDCGGGESTMDNSKTGQCWPIPPFLCSFHSQRRDVFWNVRGCGDNVIDGSQISLVACWIGVYFSTPSNP